MENFSKFFDSIVSGNKSVATKDPNLDTDNSLPATDNYNDNNMYNSNNIYNSSDTRVFPSEDYYLLANEVILGAIKLHYDLYDERMVPYVFIAYYMNQFNKHKEDQGQYLKTFLVLFHNKKNNVANAINIFSRTYKNDSAIKFANKNSHLPQLRQSYYIEITKELLNKTIAYSDKIDNNLRTAINQTRKIINEIASTTTENNFKFHYLEYLASAATNNPNPTSQEVAAPESQELKITRKRTMIAPPRSESEGKITSITLPRLAIGKIYPTSFTHSRIDSEHFAWKFIEGDRLYELLRKYKFNRVKYTNGFEVKRKALFEVKKSAFDLF